MSEEWLPQAVFFLVRLVEAAGAIVIFSGAVIEFVRFVFRAIPMRSAESFDAVRLDLDRVLALGPRVPARLGSFEDHGRPVIQEN